MAPQISRMALIQTWQQKLINWHQNVAPKVDNMAPVQNVAQKLIKLHQKLIKWNQFNV